MQSKKLLKAALCGHCDLEILFDAVLGAASLACKVSMAFSLLGHNPVWCEKLLKKGTSSDTQEVEDVDSNLFWGKYGSQLPDEQVPGEQITAHICLFWQVKVQTLVTMQLTKAADEMLAQPTQILEGSILVESDLPSCQIFSQRERPLLITLQLISCLLADDDKATL